MRQLPAGRFFPRDSPIHALDARAKVISFLILLAAVVGTYTVHGYALIIATVTAILYLTRLPLYLAIGSLRRMWAFLGVIFVMNAFFFDTATPLWSWWIFTLSQAGIRQGFHVVAHVGLIIILSHGFTMTTSPMDITKALESLIKPLQRIGVPTDDVALIISVAIQFIPTLLEEADMIKKAQIARGARFESRRLVEKATSYLPLIVPIFLAAFRRADELAQAIEARGYRSASRRTKKRHLPWRRPDYIALVVSMAVCILQFTVLR
jgi:energy-coupling factor transport system permease protein